MGELNTLNKDQIIEKLNSIFHKVFNNSSIVINDNLTAKDVENWDSLTHIQLILEIEKVFKIKFALSELQELENVGQLINFISAKLL